MSTIQILISKKEFKKELLDLSSYLTSIAEQETDSLIFFNSSYGLCFNITEFIYRNKRPFFMCADIIETINHITGVSVPYWYLYSGDKAYPVTINGTYTPSILFDRFKSYPKYDSSTLYGRNRLNLALYWATVFKYLAYEPKSKTAKLSYASLENQLPVSIPKQELIAKLTYLRKQIREGLY